MESALAVSNLVKYLFLGGLYLFILGLFWALWRQMKEFTGREGRIGAERQERAAGKQVSTLVVESGGVGGKRFRVERDLSIGRSAENAIVLPDPFASSHHATVLRRGKETWLVDEGSTNGTFLNGFRITGRSLLRPGDTFVVGGTTFRLILE